MSTSNLDTSRALAGAVACVLALLWSVAARPAETVRYDLVIRNGRVIDSESGLDAVRDLGINAGKVAIISSEPIIGRASLDVRDLVVAPGFIDLHRHGQDAENDAIAASDGVTTSLELEIGTADVDAWYGSRAGRALINFGVSVGHVPVRMTVMDEIVNTLPSGDAAHRPATASQIEEMKRLIARGLERGALAVGLAPTYTPAASHWEIMEMFAVAAKYRASCHIHVRAPLEVPEGDVSGVEEAIAAAFLTGAPLHIVHIQSTSGPNVANELRMIDQARARGLDVTTEAYPYSRGQSAIQSSLYDGKENAPDSFFATLIWPETGETLTRESFLRYRKQGGIVIDQATTEADMRLAVNSPLTMIASDGRIVGGKGHPRAAGTYAHVLGRYVREDQALSLMEALGKMTIMPARRLESRAPAMKNKGRIRVGADADLTIFDPRIVIDAATFRQPNLPSKGIRYVLVNGTVVVDGGRVIANVFPGAAVRAAVQ